MIFLSEKLAFEWHFYYYSIRRNRGKAGSKKETAQTKSEGAIINDQMGFFGRYL